MSGFAAAMKAPPLLRGQILAQTAFGEEVGHGVTVPYAYCGVNVPAKSGGKGLWQVCRAEFRPIQSELPPKPASGCNIIFE